MKTKLLEDMMEQARDVNAVMARLPDTPASDYQLGLKISHDGLSPRRYAQRLILESIPPSIAALKLQQYLIEWEKNVPCGTCREKK